MSLDMEVLVIGAGMSGIGIGVQLVRQLRLRSFEIIEKSDDVGGTWWLNTYPGCGCDVPSHFYSFSFALKHDWTRVYAMQPEIQTYFKSVADKYDIPKHITFNSAVLSAFWDEKSATWLVTILDQKSEKVYHRRCKILISAVGALSIPKKCEIQGAESFKGRLFHSAQWDQSFDWKGKKVIAIGNGCSATQFVPIISSGPDAVSKVTQFSRQAHWLSERPNPEYSSLFQWNLNWVPGVMRIYRAHLYWRQEKLFSGFQTESGLAEREAWTKEAAAYIRKAAPAKYADALVPKTVIGCKRRVNDTDYLASLHRDNVELIYDDPIQRIVENGVQTKSGRMIGGDAIILATDFETQKALFPMEIRGEGGVSLDEHWNAVSQGSPSAYFGTCLSKFPNFFVMMGPNTLSGHLSVIYTTECQINFTMRVIKPIIQFLHPERSLLPALWGATDRVAVTAEAERGDDDWVQHQARKIVWGTGCSSWFIDPQSGRNTIMYPDYQYKFWLRSFWIPWSHFAYSTSPNSVGQASARRNSSLRRILGIATTITGIVATTVLLQDPQKSLLNEWSQSMAHTLKILQA